MFALLLLKINKTAEIEVSHATVNIATEASSLAIDCGNPSGGDGEREGRGRGNGLLAGSVMKTRREAWDSLLGHWWKRETWNSFCWFSDEDGRHGTS
jgi:hypothetical protein